MNFEVFFKEGEKDGIIIDFFSQINIRLKKNKCQAPKD